MQNLLNIEQLNTREKFIMMEQLWDSLSAENSVELSPNWHLEVLDNRESKILDESNFIDIESSKKLLKTLIK